MVSYEKPRSWIFYDHQQVAQVLVEAKSTVLSLRTIPFQRSWVEALQKMELKREVGGTSRIEGAEFTERELDAAMKETPEQLLTRSQRQAHAALVTYNISKVEEKIHLSARLEWPTEITETEFFAKIKLMPTAKTHAFLT